MATMRAEVEMRKTRVHTGFHEDAERKRRLRHSERAHSRPNNPETWARRAYLLGGSLGLERRPRGFGGLIRLWREKWPIVFAPREYKKRREARQNSPECIGHVLPSVGLQRRRHKYSYPATKSEQCWQRV